MLSLASIPLPIGQVGVILLALSFIAAFLVSYLDRVRKHHSSKGVSSATKSNRCTVIYGTQTGTAERFAKSLKSQLESKYGGSTQVEVVDAETYIGEEQLPHEQLIFFIMATQGDGEPTDNATAFYNWLVDVADNSGGETLCKDVSYGVFALGNKQYEHFCAVGKKVHRSMQELGATAIVHIGTGDDDDDIDRDFDSWSAVLFGALESSPILQASSMVATSASVISYDIEDVSNAIATEPVDVQSDGSGLSQSSPHLATVTVVRELHTAQSDRSCVHLELDITKSAATYEAGDHIAVFAENSPDIVAAAAVALGVDLDKRFKMKIPSGTNGMTVPPSGVLTVRGALSRYADLLTAPSKAALSALAVFATDQTEAEQLADLASIEGREAYNDYIIAGKRSLLEVLHDFPSAKPSLGAFFGSIVPRLQPRFYSISSSATLHPRSVHITVAVVRDIMPSGRIHNGVASSWLARMKPGAQVPVFIRRSSFKLPKDPSTPVIMVGPGTGIAPFRGFIQERAALLSKNTNLGLGVLYFGCRREDQDYIYREELEGYLNSGSISELDVAFSRQTAAKDYVQHHIARQGDLVWKLLSNGGYFYVCGEAKHMAKDVNQALVQIVSSAKGGKANAGEAFIKTLGDSGRYLKDVW